MSNFLLSKNEIWENTEFWKTNTEKSYVSCIQNLIASKPFGNRKFYIYSFVKRVDDSSGIKRMYHQPRLTRPDPVPGTTLMKVDPSNPEDAIIIWTLPNQENFALYKHGKMFASQFVHECIDKFQRNPKELTRPDIDDLNDDQIREVYREIKHLAKVRKATQEVSKKTIHDRISAP